MNRKISIIEDLDGNKTVVIHDIMFKGKRSINWDEVEDYLRKYIDELYCVAETGDEIFIGKDLPSEYAGSILDGIDMTPDLHCQFSMILVKSKDSMCSKHEFWSDMQAMERSTCTIL